MGCVRGAGAWGLVAQFPAPLKAWGRGGVKGAGWRGWSRPRGGAAHRYSPAPLKAWGRGGVKSAGEWRRSRPRGGAAYRYSPAPLKAWGWTG